MKPRGADEVWPDYRNRGLTLLRVRNGDIEFEHRVAGKRLLVATRTTTDLFLLVWTGQWHSDVFEIDPDRLRRELGTSCVPGNHDWSFDADIGLNVCSRCDHQDVNDEMYEEMYGDD